MRVGGAALPADYAERVYVGVLGLARPVAAEDGCLATERVSVRPA